MAHPIPSSYIPSTINSLADNGSKRIQNHIGAWAFIQFGEHCDCQHAKVDSGDVHVMYKELYDSTIGCKPGEPG